MDLIHNYFENYFIVLIIEDEEENQTLLNIVKRHGKRVTHKDLTKEGLRFLANTLGESISETRIDMRIEKYYKLEPTQYLLNDLLNHGRELKNLSKRDKDFYNELVLLLREMFYPREIVN